MLISLNKKFLFIHVYKVAGSSIREALLPYSYDPRTEFINRVYNKLIRNIFSNHETKLLVDGSGLGHLLLNIHTENIHHVKVSDIESFNSEILNNFYTFAFVRNPWDWQVSLYHFMLQNPKHKKHTLIKKMGNFKEYLKWHIENGVRYQTDFLLNHNGELAVDYVGRLETIEEDFCYLCKKLNLNASLPHQNQSQHKKYLELYDEESKQLVEDAFQKDIKLLGYSFDDYDKQPVHEIIQQNLK